jgi:cell wall-associated NlpC family hydrolase
VTERDAFVAEARSWVGTPYHLGAMVKGAGCDCGTFLLGALQACGMAKAECIERFTHDWFFHTDDPRYLRAMLRNARKVAEEISYRTLHALPGDLALTRSSNSRLYNHGGIVVKWPKVIHAIHPAVCECDATAHELWCFRTVAVFDPFQKGDEC